ncbi:unnamed protein product [Scytosiphon promiscuus]
MDQQISKKIRRQGNMSGAESSATLSSLRSTGRNPAAITLDALPALVLSLVANFSQEGHLSGACRSTLEAIRELHYKINIHDTAQSFSLAEDPTGALAKGHMGLQPSGTLATGRVVARITVTGCSDYKKTKRGYQVLEKTVQRVVQHSIPTLCSISVSGGRGKDSAKVAAIIGALVPVSVKRHRVAPRLTRVHLRHGANGVVKAGKAIAAGLWPALEELQVPGCHGKIEHFLALSKALRSGQAPKLRVLNWDRQSLGAERVDNEVLGALSAGKCPRIERLSFTEKYYLRELKLDSLGDALLACPNLLELRMDLPRAASQALGALTAVLQAEGVPRLASVAIRVRTFDGLEAEIGALKIAAASRVPPIRVKLGLEGFLGF